MNEFENKSLNELLTIKLCLESYIQGVNNLFKLIQSVSESTLTISEKRLIEITSAIDKLQKSEDKK